ncbi:MAG: hypothetical protein AAF465_07005 [Pseudomonadota bacterium]
MLFFAGLIAIVVAIVHSVLGERLLFSRMRVAGVIPTNGYPLLRERHVRILWATWHLVSVFGVAIGASLLIIDRADSVLSSMRVVLWSVIVMMTLGALLVCVATRGRHPGWLGLGAVALLTFGHLQALSSV